MGGKVCVINSKSPPAEACLPENLFGGQAKFLNIFEF